MPLATPPICKVSAVVEPTATGFGLAESVLLKGAAFVMVKLKGGVLDEALKFGVARVAGAQASCHLLGPSVIS